MEDILVSIINKVTEKHYNSINYSDGFKTDLGISSLEYFEIVIDIELQYNLTLPDELLLYEENITFGQIIEGLKGLLL
ncbi:acyl carrier protein [Kineothrix alysoides]|uniref:Acyl carrier protein n=1 Tax=Kineothrix alysoides TaxID=1469948 RepID=A0A4V2QBF6_9FIRM|nr:phosphopantetheine-binding protein [Kineothrix alysoides]TCL56202.1 acyl carrier protein [Kineothrix alysoides]